MVHVSTAKSSLKSTGLEKFSTLRILGDPVSCRLVIKPSFLVKWFTFPGSFLARDSLCCTRCLLSFGKLLVRFRIERN